jgi:hypothetical protein
MNVMNFSKAAVANATQKAALDIAAEALQRTINGAAAGIVETHLNGTPDQLRTAAEAFAQQAFDACYSSLVAASPAGAFDGVIAQVKRDFSASLVTHQGHCLRYAEISAQAQQYAQRDAWQWLTANVRAGAADATTLSAFDSLGERVVATCWMGNEDLPEGFKASLSLEVRGTLRSVLKARAEILEQARRQVDAEEAAARHDVPTDDRRHRAAEVFARAGIQMPASGTTTADMRAAWATAAGLDEHAAAFALDTSLADPSTAQLVIAEAHEVKELGAITGQPTLAASLIRARKSPADARAALQDALAAADEAIPIQNARSTLKPKASPGADINVFAIYDRFNGRKP